MGVLPGWAIYAADLVFAMFMLINLMGCLWLFTGLTENDQGGHCWLESVGELSAASREEGYVMVIHLQWLEAACCSLPARYTALVVH